MSSVAEQLEPRRLLAGDGLRAQYFDNADFSAPKVERVDATVNFDWGYGSPAVGVGADTFSVRWTGQLEAEKTEEYTFHTNSDDGVRLWVNNQLIIDNWTVHAPTVNTGKLSLVAGQKYDIRMDYFENHNGAIAQVWWSSATTPRQVIPQARLYSGATAQKPTISIVASDSNAAEQGNNPGVFTISRTGDTSRALSIRVSMSGTAGAGDFTMSPLLPGYVTIPAGQSATTVTITPIDDALFEGDETFTMTLQPFVWEADLYDFETSSATVTLADNDQPPQGDSVYLSDLNWASATSPYSGAKKDQGTLGGTLTINGQTFAKGLGVHSPSTVIYNLDGQYTTFTAQVGIDDAVGNLPTDGTVVFEVWVDNVLRKSVRRTGADAAEAITVDLTGARQLKLITTTGGDSDYKDHADWADAKLTRGAVPSAKPQVSVSLTDGTGTEKTSGSDPIAFTVSRTQPTDQPLTVIYALGGTALPGGDYRVWPDTMLGEYRSVTIPAGETSVTVTVTPSDDAFYEPGETVILTLHGQHTYTIAAANTQTAIINDNDPVATRPTVTIAASSDRLEEVYGAQVTVRVSRTGDVSQPLFVELEASGSPNETDWLTPAQLHNLEIPAGQSHVEFRISPYRDLAVEGDETFTLSVKPRESYTVGDPPSSTITIIDNDFVRERNIVLSDRTAASASSPYFGVHKDESVLGRTLTIGGQTFNKGLGVHSASRVVYNFIESDMLSKFSAWVGVDDEVGNTPRDGSVVFEVWADGTLVATSGKLTGADGARHIEAALNNTKELVLVTTTADDGDYKDHADWGDVILTQRYFDGRFS